MRFLSIEEVIEIHTSMIQDYGGLDGIRDMGLLLSAIEMPKAAMFGEYLHPSIFDKAAAYLFHIVSNHPFLDGNKRTGSAAALVFLEMNKIAIEFEEREFEELVVRVAEGKAEKEELSAYFEKNA
jgi:death-on-curing protein